MGTGASKKPTTLKEDTGPPSEDQEDQATEKKNQPDESEISQQPTQSGYQGQNNVPAQTSQPSQRLNPNPPKQKTHDQEKQLNQSQPGQASQPLPPHQHTEEQGQSQKLNQQGLPNQSGQQGQLPPQIQNGQERPPPFNPALQQGQANSQFGEQPPNSAGSQEGQTNQQCQGEPNSQFQQGEQPNQQWQGGPPPNSAWQQGQPGPQWEGHQPFNPTWQQGQPNQQWQNGPPPNAGWQQAGQPFQQWQGGPPPNSAWQQGQQNPPWQCGPSPNSPWPQAGQSYQQWPRGPPPNCAWQQGQPRPPWPYGPPPNSPWPPIQQWQWGPPNIPMWQQGQHNEPWQAEHSPNPQWQGKQRPSSSWQQRPQSQEWQGEQPPNLAFQESQPNQHQQSEAPLNLDWQNEQPDEQCYGKRTPKLAWQEGQTGQGLNEQCQSDQLNQTSQFRRQPYQPSCTKQSETLQGQPNSQVAQQPNQLYQGGQGNQTCLATNGHQTGQSHLETTKTISVGVDPDVMEYIEDSKYKDELKMLLGKENLRLQWSQGSSFAILEYTGQRNESKCVEMLHSFLNTFGKHDLPIKKEIWEKVQIQMAAIRASLGVTPPLVKSFKDQLKIRIVSLWCNIESCRSHFEAKLTEMYNEVTSITETMSSVSKETINFLKAINFKEKRLREKCKDLEVDLDEGKQEIRLVGPKEQLNIAKTEFQEQFQAITKKALTLDPDVLQILATEQGRKAVKEALEDGNIEAIMVFPSGYQNAKVLASSKEHAEESASLISGLLTEEKLTVTPNHAPLTTEKSWSDYCEKIKKKNGVLIRNRSGEICIVGLRSNAENAAKKLQYFLDNNAEIEEEYRCPSSDVKEYILRRLKPEVETCGVKVKDGDDILSFYISGKQECLKKTKDLLDKLCSDLKTSNLEFQQPGLKKFSESGDLDARVKEVEEREECFIRVEKILSSTRPAGRDSASGQTSLQSRTPSSGAPGTLPSTFFVTPQGQKVSWKSGDITKEQVDALVIPQGACFNRIRSYFSQAICQAVDELKFGEIATSSPGTSLPCNHVIHSCCSFWNGSGNTGEGTLRTILQKSLHEVCQLGGKSIAFPIIGTGNLRFPPNEACRIMLEEAVTFYQRNPHSIVKDICFVVFSGDKSLVGTFQKEAIKIQNQGTNTVQSSVGVNCAGMIEIANGDLTKETTDAIVNINSTSMNMTLAGELSKAVAKASGPQVQQECSQLGSQRAGSAVMTSGGNLMVPNIIHIIPGSSDKQHLQQCLEEGLRLADRKSLKSISIPAIGTGGFGLSATDSAQVTFQAVRNVCGSFSSITKVRIVVYQTRMMQDFQQEQQNLSVMNSKVVPPLATQGVSIRIDVINGDLTRETTEAIVNINSTTMDMNSAGELGKAVAKASGPQVQQECSQMGPQRAGSAVMTSGGNLLVPNIIHIIPGSSDKQHLQQCLEEGLRLADRKSLKSISIPAVGTGGYGLSATDSAQVTFQAVQNVCSSLNSVSKVRIVVFQATMMQAFQQEHQKHSMIPNKLIPPPAAQGSPILVDVINDDLTKESTDAIVNINSTSMDMNCAGQLGKAVAKASGPQVQQECSRLGSQRAGSAVMTSAGNLLVPNIIHIIPGSSDKQHLQQCLEEGLRLADGKGLKSISIPAVGTGGYGLSAVDSAQVVFKALSSFSGRCVNIRNVRVVVYQSAMMQAFLQEKAQTDTQYASQGSSRPVTGMHQSWKPTVRVWVTAKSTTCVDKAMNELKKIFAKACVTETVSIEDIHFLSQRQVNNLQREAFQHDTQIKFDHVAKSVMVRGYNGNVHKMTSKIKDEISKAIKEKSQRQEDDNARAMLKIVEWSHESGGTRVVFDPKTNAKLEMARSKKELTVQVTIRGKQFDIDLRNLTGTCRSDGEQVKIFRNPKEEQQGISLPNNWSPMPPGMSVCTVKLTPGFPEYLDVEKKFRTSLPRENIVKIERIQNPLLYQSYMVRKQKKDKDIRRNSERQLFHGTDGKNISQINSNGFNRSFCGINGTAYGRGVYFARDASYSARFAGGVAGSRQMYLARVLVGEYCPGNPQMITAPPKNPIIPTVLYESVVDNPANPTIFVVFFDSTCYPEYLITF